MQVVILSGGLGTRLRSLAPNIPKAMVPVTGRPFVYHQLDMLKQQGFTDILMCVGYLGDQIQSELGDGSSLGVSIRYAWESEGVLLGTGGALVNALPKLQNHFLVMYGDSYLPIDFKRMAEWIQEKHISSAMSVFRNEGRWDHSNTQVKSGLVSFYSKTALPGECSFIDYGLLFFHKETILKYLGHPMPLDLSTIQKQLVEAHEMAAYEVTERFYEVGKPEGLAELESFLGRQNSPSVLP
jgi:N-acetyl-alpha-D-muramate 1-phosphate uridylyltransferase